MSQVEGASFDLLSEKVKKAARELGLEQETEIQTRAIPAILNGENVLIIAPTGSGKTEAALLPIFERITNEKKEGTRAIYVTPLRALNRDMLRRISAWSSSLGLSVEVRHGDTPKKERTRQSIHPPDLLITTPETLQVVLVGSRLRAGLKNLDWIVVDEIHQLASDRRGSQLSLAIERLERLTCRRIQRIGISATIGNPEQVSQFLSGQKGKCTIVDASRIPKLAGYSIELPEPCPEDQLRSRELYVSSQTVARMQRIVDLVKGHDRTLVFVNSKTNAESLGSRLLMLGLKVGVHHGSLPREERERVEQEFKEGKIGAMVSTSTLELGIDIGSVDLVVQYMSPRQVNSLVQRVGRSGHSLGKKSEGIVLAVSPEDALESISISLAASRKDLEPVVIHENSLDVLAHQIAGILLEDFQVGRSWLLEFLRSSYSFRTLSKDSLDSVLNFMQKLGYLQIQDSKIIRRWKCRSYYFENISMIPDERRYSVIDLTTQQRVGILGEEFMILHAKVGVHFIIKGRVWQIETIQQESVYVTPVQDPTAAVPGWDGELLPIPRTVASMMGSERRKVMEALEWGGVKELTQTTRESWNADRTARSRVIEELELQFKEYSIPTDRNLVVEKFDRYLILHTSLGDRINTTLGELFEEVLLRMGLVRHWWSDGHRILIELVSDDFELERMAAALLSFDPRSTPGFLKSVIRKHFPFGYRMKFIAERFGALKRGMMLSEEALKELTVKFRFTPIYEETLREAELTQIDVPGAIELLENVKEKTVALLLVDSEKPSPLAKYILLRYAEVEEYEESEDSVESMKASIGKEIVSLLCFNCASLQEFVRISDLDEVPKCPTCSSPLLAVLFYGTSFVRDILLKRKKGDLLSSQESEILAKTRRSADIILSYGKKGVISQAVYGIGPQTALRILSKMHAREEDFYKDLIESKLKFIQTKPYWD